MKKTLLLVFIHGFKGSDDTFEGFPKDLRQTLAEALPKINVLAVQYPKYETRGDLKECVARFKDWLQNKVIDLEVDNGTPSPTVDPSVHVVLCGHSMGGIVAAETLLSIAKDEPIPAADIQPPNYNDTTSAGGNSNPRNTTASVGSDAGKSEKQTNSSEPSRLFFPYIQGVMAFDTPYLGISPGVLAHGAEEQINHASAAYKAFDQASSFFGFKGSTTNASAAAAPIPDAASRGLPAPASTAGGGWGRWGTLAMYGGAAAAIASAAGAAYLNRGQIMEGFAWASSHLEFVGCLARGAELQRRVEGVIQLTKSHGTGFVNFYTALDEKTTNKSTYSGAVLGNNRTFCIIPMNTKEEETPVGAKRQKSTGDSNGRTSKRRKSDTSDPIDAGVEDGQRVQDFAADTSKSKGLWIKCLNSAVKDEVSAHRAMFTPSNNTHYSTMLSMTRVRIVQWVDKDWYEDSDAPDIAT